MMRGGAMRNRAPRFLFTGFLCSIVEKEGKFGGKFGTIVAK